MLMNLIEWKRKIFKEYNLSFNDINYILKKILNLTEIDILDKKIILEEEIKLIQPILMELKQGKPLNKIFNCQNFYGIDFYINENVLAPRKETEILVEKALMIAKDKKLNVLDLCCGSGVIGLTFKYFNKISKVTLSDISELAIEVSKKNAKNLELDVEIVKSDLFKDIKKQKFDLILCNPPYIKNKDKENLDISVINYDPEIALYGGEDGLDFYRRIKEEILNFSDNNTILIFEIGYDIYQDLLELYSEFKIETIKDYSGIERILVIKK